MSASGDDHALRHVAQESIREITTALADMIEKMAQDTKLKDVRGDQALLALARAIRTRNAQMYGEPEVKDSTPPRQRSFDDYEEGVLAAAKVIITECNLAGDDILEWNQLEDVGEINHALSRCSSLDLGILAKAAKKAHREM